MGLGRRTFLASTLSAVAAPAVIRLAFADAPQFTFKLHHALSSVSSGHDQFLVPWARKIEAESGGRIRIDIFPAMELGGQPAQLFDQARDGVVDIVWTAPRRTPGRFPKIETFELPFAVSRRALVCSKAIQDFAAAHLKDEFSEVHPLCFSCADRGVVHANRPVRTADDIEGLRLHVQTRFAAEAVSALGGRPVPMPSAQLPIALSQQVVDGGIDPWTIVPPLKLDDVLKTHTDFAGQSLSTTTLVLAMNRSAYERLPADLKAVMDINSGPTAAAMAGAVYDLQASAVADGVSQHGGTIITLLPEAVAHWRKVTAPVVEAWLKAMKENKTDGGKLLGSAHTLLAKYANEPEPQRPQPPSEQQQAVAQPEQAPDRRMGGAPGPAAPTATTAPTAPAPAAAPVPAAPPAPAAGATAAAPPPPAAPPSAPVAPAAQAATVPAAPAAASVAPAATPAPVAPPPAKAWDIPL